MTKKQNIKCPYCEKSFNYYGESCYCECHHCHMVYNVDPGELHVLTIKVKQLAGLEKYGRLY